MCLKGIIQLGQFVTQKYIFYCMLKLDLFYINIARFSEFSSDARIQLGKCTEWPTNSPNLNPQEFDHEFHLAAIILLDSGISFI
jgi:hypothetical protein